MNRRRAGELAEILLDYFEHNRTFQSNKVMAVPAADFSDPDRWSAEIELIFKRVPLMLALSCEMPNPGDYKAMEAVGRPILISRDKTGTARAFLNVCAHRWAPVTAEGRGHCSRFVCPFHGWAYGTDGQLLGIADRFKFGDIDRAAHGLKELACAERHGMIFVCLTPGIALDLTEYYGALLDEYADAGLKDHAFLGSRVVEGVNWKSAMNNFLESYHFATLHRTTVAQQLVSNISHYEGFGPNIRLAVLRKSIGQLREVPRAQWGEQEGLHFGFIRIFFPNVTGFISIEPDIVVFTQTFPGARPEKSRLVLLFARKLSPQGAADRQKVAELIDYTASDVTQDEDVAIGVGIQKALESKAHDALLYGRNEGGNQYFHEWIDWYLQGDPTRPKPVL
jgi:phenylpropionate dioxygenase-like ring-hydroxylating dioxygenase large terminal subunit